MARILRFSSIAKLLVGASVVLSLWSPQAWCQQKVGTVSPAFLNYVNSARANGMGSCAIDLVNEESALYNPGGIGLFHLSKTVAVAWPQTTKWLPTLTDDLRLKSYTLSAGMSSQRLHWGKDPLLNVSLAFAFSRLQLDFPSLMEYAGVSDRADCYTIAIGADYLIRVGIGYTYKRITEDITESWYPEGPGSSSGIVANGEDVGITVELPLWRIWHLKHPQKALEPPPAVQITPRYTFVMANSPRNSGVLPLRHNQGLSLHAKYVRNGLSAVDLTLVGEIEKPHLSEGRLLKGGMELGLLEVCYLCLGRFKDDPLEGYGREINTLGLGFSLNGLIKYTRIIEHVHPSHTQLRWLLANLDVRFDYARYGGDEDQYFRDTKYYSLTISL